jgi:DNA-binding response OmpR family regulator
MVGPYGGERQRSGVSLPDVRPDTLLTEVALPGLDGIAVCREVRSTRGGEALPTLVLPPTR